METKYFIRFLALCYLDNFAFYDLIGSFNALVRESDNSIPDIDMDDNLDDVPTLDDTEEVDF